MPLLNVSLGIGFAGARHEDTIEINDEIWENCESDEEREALIDEHATDWASNYIDIGAELVEE